MKTVAVAALLALVVVAGCRGQRAAGEPVQTGNTGLGDTEQVNYVHDDKRGVGCWIYVSSSNTSISCLSDQDYQP